MVKATGQHVPGSQPYRKNYRSRDYPMSTHGNKWMIFLVGKQRGGQILLLEWLKKGEGAPVLESIGAYRERCNCMQIVVQDWNAEKTRVNNGMLERRWTPTMVVNNMKNPSSPNPPFHRE